MTKTSRGRARRHALLCASTILCAGLAAPAFAASPHPNLDANGVDLTEGTYNPRLAVASIGSGDARLDLVMLDDRRDNYSQIMATRTVSGGTTTITIDLGTHFDSFRSTDGFAQSIRGTGATLTIDSAESYTYRTLEGVVIVLTNPVGQSPFGGASNLCDDYNANNCFLLAQSVSGRSGMSVEFDWFVNSNCAPPQNPDDPVPCTHTWRLQNVHNDAGYSIDWTFAGGPVGHPDWHRRTSAQLKNANVSASSWPTVTIGAPSGGVTAITTPGGKVWRITRGIGITGLRRPSASSDTTTVGYNGSGKVSSVTADGVTTGYNYSVSGTTATMVVTDAQSNTTTIVSDLAKFRPTSVTNALGHVTAMAYDSIGRPTEIAYPEGNKTQFAYDARGNLTTVTQKAKPGSGLADIVSSAGYDASCANVATCNRPNWTQDAKGNQTDYTYDAATGLPLTVTLPAATGGANRPQTRYSYTTSNGVSLLTGVSTCQTGVAPACVGTADEVKTTTTHNTNLLAVSTSAGAGNGSLTATSGFTYDAVGNLLTVDGPLAGTADTSRTRYDADRQVVGVIGPDPDGGSALKHRAQRITYNADGQPTLAEQGTVNSQSDGDWTAFAPLAKRNFVYDANARPITTMSIGSDNNVYAVTQASYDALGRPECSAERMNPATWSSLPGACSLATTGSFGPDRIAKTSYDAASQVTKVQSAYGTADQSDEVTSTYSSNGRLTTATDAEGNKTTWEYDGHDRLLKSRFPLPATPGSSSTTDYEQLTYDANGNVTQKRLRDGNLIGYSYDALDRMTVKDTPNLNFEDQDVIYEYDLLGRLKRVEKNNLNIVTLGYDALGRKTSEGNYYYTLTSQYDLAGRRTRLTWNDGFYVDYDYLVTGETTHVRENGAGSGVGVLGSYAYDDLGRRASLTRGNGTVTSYGYDPVSRLSSLAHNLTGTTHDVTTTFGHNPASQIASSTRDNDVYAWGGHYNVDRPYTVNGLNQLTTAGATSLGYDGRGNLTSSGSQTYQYTSENRFFYAPGQTDLRYDGLGRLHYVSATNTTLITDGDMLVAESTYNGGVAPFTRRYVHGPGTDEVLVWYQIGDTDLRRWLIADERGSVVAVTKEDGAVMPNGINRYDEYGIPAATNVGRFQYTGQAWLPELGMYYYKARMYSATLGRFMQTDPIGYDDGMNMYAYVAGDPVNGRDPSGLAGIGTDWGCNTITVINGSWRCAGGGGGGGGRGSGGGGFGGVSFGGSRFQFDEPISGSQGGGSGSGGEAATQALIPGIGHNSIPMGEMATALCVSQPLACAGLAGTLLLSGDTPQSSKTYGPLPSDQAPNKISSIARDQLDRQTLIAARLELRGITVSTKGPGGQPFDHVTKVRQGQQGVLNRIFYINGVLSNPSITQGQRHYYQQQLSTASKLLDYSRRFVP